MNLPPSSSASQDRLLELLADQATQGLPVGEQAELDLLRKRYPDIDDTAFELIAAELALAMGSPGRESMPRDLRDQIEAQLHTLESVKAQPVPFRQGGSSFKKGPRAFFPPLIAWGGWVAAAASLSFLVWNGGYGSSPSPRQVMAALQSRNDVLRVKGQPPKADNPANPWVEIIWCPYGHYGCLRLHGLAVNDPTREQYQLWVYDKQRDPRYPIDGGVFNVSGDGEAIISVKAKLKVHEVIRFAVTREPAGGVVVPDGELLLLAELKHEQN